MVNYKYFFEERAPRHLGMYTASLDIINLRYRGALSFAITDIYESLSVRTDSVLTLRRRHHSMLNHSSDKPVFVRC